MNRRAVLAAVGAGMASISGCLGTGDPGGNESNGGEPADDEEHGFDSYEVTVTDSSGDGDLSLSAETTHDATEEHPAVIELSVENQADEERMYREIPDDVPVPFHFGSLDYEGGEQNIVLKSIGDTDVTDLGSERHGQCWYYDPMRLSEAAKISYDPGESATYRLAVFGRAPPEDDDPPDEDRCTPDGEYVGTQLLDEYDAPLGPDFDEEDNHLGEITLRLELEISRD